MIRGTNSAIYMIAGGHIAGGRMHLSCLVTEQARSLRQLGFKIFFGVVDDRMSLKGVSRNIKRLRADVQGIRPKVVHVQYGSVVAFVALCVRGRIPLIVSFGGSDLFGIPIPGLRRRTRNLLGRYLGLWSAQHATRIIVKSRNLFENLPNRLQEKTIILPNGVDTEFFRPLIKNKCRAKLGWRPDTRIVLFYSFDGEDKAVKNLPLARNAVENLTANDHGVKLFVMSNAKREDVRLMMNASDCLLVTSLHEGSPNVVKEAMACNLPVVSVPCGDVEERLKNVSPGGVYRYDASALANGIRHVLEEGKRSNGRDELIRQGLTASGVAMALVGVYERVLR